MPALRRSATQLSLHLHVLAGASYEYAFIFDGDSDGFGVSVRIFRAWTLARSVFPQVFTISKQQRTPERYATPICLGIIPDDGVETIVMGAGDRYLIKLTKLAFHFKNSTWNDLPRWSSEAERDRGVLTEEGMALYTGA